MSSKLPVPGLGSVMTVFFFIVASWILVHLVAIFGVFVAMAYPVWWLLAPRRTPCLFCRIKRQDQKCFSCREVVRNIGGSGPKTFLSVFLNMMLILLVSFVSAGFVYIESRVLFKIGFPSTPQTVSFVIPPKGQYRLGEVFPMKIDIAGVVVPINAIQADVSFDPRKLEVVDILTEDSFANIFIQKEINNKVGYARLTGGLPNPGFFADHGVFGTILFKGKSPGVVKIDFLPSSMVLANDGRGTNILKDLASVSYLILPERISEKEVELQKNISIGPAVLGDRSDGTQMKFYEEKRVLGVAADQEIQKEISFSLGRFLLSGLEKIDRFTLTLWEKIHNIFK